MDQLGRSEVPCWTDRKMLIAEMPDLRSLDECYPVLYSGEARPRLVGIRADPFVGKDYARNCKIDKARDGAVVSIVVHAFWCLCGGVYYIGYNITIEVEDRVF